MADPEGRGNPNHFGIAMLDPDYFKIQEFPGGGLDGMAMIHRRYSGDPVPTHELKHYISHWLDIAIPGRSSLHMFTGTIVLVISDKPKPGGNEKIFQYVIQTSGHRF